MSKPVCELEIMSLEEMFVSTAVEYRVFPFDPRYIGATDGDFWTLVRHGTGKRKGLPRLDGLGREQYAKMKPKLMKNGYMSIGIWKDGKKHHFRLHRAIAMCFMGPPVPGLHLCHNDGKRKNNALSNLRRDTQANNLRDRYKHGTMPCGSKAGLAKLTEADVVQIRRMHQGGKSLSQLAAAFKVTKSTIWQAARGDTFRLCDEPPSTRLAMNNHPKD